MRVIAASRAVLCGSMEHSPRETNDKVAIGTFRLRIHFNVALARIAIWGVRREACSRYTKLVSQRQAVKKAD